jgi:hypothetical protein
MMATYESGGDLSGGDGCAADRVGETEQDRSEQDGDGQDVQVASGDERSGGVWCRVRRL